MSEAERSALGMKPSAELRGHQRPEIGSVEARGEDHPRCRVEIGKPLRDLEAVEVRQLHVDERQIGAVCLRLLDAPAPLPASATTTKPASRAAVAPQCGRRCCRRR